MTETSPRQFLMTQVVKHYAPPQSNRRYDQKLRQSFMSALLGVTFSVSCILPHVCLAGKPQVLSDKWLDHDWQECNLDGELVRNGIAINCNRPLREVRIDHPRCGELVLTNYQEGSYEGAGVVRFDMLCHHHGRVAGLAGVEFLPANQIRLTLRFVEARHKMQNEVYLLRESRPKFLTVQVATEKLTEIAGSVGGKIAIGVVIMVLGNILVRRLRLWRSRGRPG